MNKLIPPLIVTALLTASSAKAASIVINFDTDASGNPISAPGVFLDTTHLTELYAPLGVHFSGPTGNDGGAILNQSGGFGVNALSGVNFLAFNRQATMMDGGTPRDPEAITFDTLMSRVSIFAAGGSTTDTFRMQAFNTNGVLVDTVTVTTTAFSQLQVSSPLGIKSVTLSVSAAADGAFVFDDLSADPIPEPSTALLLCAAFAFGGFSRATCPRRK